MVHASCPLSSHLKDERRQSSDVQNVRALLFQNSVEREFATFQRVVLCDVALRRHREWLQGYLATSCSSGPPLVMGTQRQDHHKRLLDDVGACVTRSAKRSSGECVCEEVESRSKTLHGTATPQQRNCSCRWTNRTGFEIGWMGGEKCCKEVPNQDKLGVVQVITSTLCVLFVVHRGHNTTASIR